MENEKKPLVLTISLARKIGLPAYGNAECFLSISGIEKGTTEEEIDALINDEGALAYKKIAAVLRTKTAEILKEAGF